jgi:DNA-binding CsgD family transcriptional regulator
MDINQRWTKIADAIAVCLAKDSRQVLDCHGLARALNGLSCGIVLHRLGHANPLYYNITVQAMVGASYAEFDAAVLLSIMPRLTPSALAYAQVYRRAFEGAAPAEQRFQCGLLDGEGREVMYYGMSAPLQLKGDGQVILTVLYDVDALVQAATADDVLMDSLTPEQNKAFGSLTQREKEVLRLMVDHLRCAEIAKRLFITPDTVQTHRKNLLRKLGVQGVLGLMPFVPLVMAAQGIQASTQKW